MIRMKRVDWMSGSAGARSGAATYSNADRKRNSCPNKFYKTSNAVGKTRFERKGIKNIGKKWSLLVEENKN